MAKWIRFDPIPVPPDRKTQRWHVVAKQRGDDLGVIEWDTGWRRYVFAPYEGSVYEQDCLRDIASFIEDETRKHKAASSAPVPS